MIVKTAVSVRASSIEHPDGRSEPVWLIDFRHPDGTLHGHGFPHAALGIRAAEYGFDPSDADTLLDVVLHEPHMNLQHHDPDFLWNTDQENARTAHLRRVAALKQSAVSIADPQGLLQKIADHYRATFDPSEHAQRVHAVEAVRRGDHAPHVQLVRNQAAARPPQEQADQQSPEPHREPDAPRSR